MTIAAVDIGTNTLLMVIARITDDSRVEILEDFHRISRLGKGVNATKRIDDASIERAAEILTEYNQICNQYSVDVRVGVGTSALRDAENGQEIITYFSNIWNGKIYCISGEEEATLTYKGVRFSLQNSNSTPQQNNISIIDIGGGSTEIIIANNDSVQVESIDIGAVRLTEKYNLQYPYAPTSVSAAKDFCIAITNPLKNHRTFCVDNILYAVAGTPTTLAMMAQQTRIFTRDSIDGYKLTLEKILMLQSLIETTHPDILTNDYGVETQRSDILFAGTLLLSTILQMYGRDSCVVSCSGLRYGVMYQAIDRITNRTIGI